MNSHSEQIRVYSPTIYPDN